MHGPPGTPGVHRKTYNHKMQRSARRRGVGTMEQKIREREAKYRARRSKTSW